jgi:hypothetical protein
MKFYFSKILEYRYLIGFILILYVFIYLMIHDSIDITYHKLYFINGKLYELFINFNTEKI